MQGLQNMIEQNIGDIRMIFGDSIKLLDSMADELSASVDLIVSDVPYLLTSGGCTEGGLHERFGQDPDTQYGNTGMLFDDVPDWSEFMPLLFGAQKDGHAYVMCNNRNVQPMLNTAEAAGYGFHNLLVWDKVSCTPNRWYMKNLEFIGFFYKGNARQINDCGANQFIRMPQVDVTKHPTEKPVALMEYYIRQSSQPGDLVMDPFMGSGTTAIACMRTGRRFVGIEKKRAWYDVAVDRVRKEMAEFQPRLFAC